MKPWILLIVAGMLETGWAVGLKVTSTQLRDDESGIPLSSSARDE